jgi:opacity protein-like surface antigen
MTFARSRVLAILASRQISARKVVGLFAIAAIAACGSGATAPVESADTIVIRNSGRDSLAYGTFEYELSKRVSLSPFPIALPTFRLIPGAGVVAPGSQSGTPLSSVDGYQRGRDITLNVYSVRADTARYQGTVIIQNAQFRKLGSIIAVDLATVPRQ